MNARIWLVEAVSSDPVDDTTLFLSAHETEEAAVAAMDKICDADEGDFDGCEVGSYPLMDAEIDDKAYLVLANIEADDMPAHSVGKMKRVISVHGSEASALSGRDAAVRKRYEGVAVADCPLMK